ncbi:MAG: hypothetical protein ACUVQH_13360 [Thermogutta sp.]
MILGVPREVYPEELRVAVIPASVPSLTKAGHVVRVETGAGTAAGFSDDDYVAKGAQIAPRKEVFAADVLLGVRWDIPPQLRTETLGLLRPGQVIVGSWDPLSKRITWPSGRKKEFRFSPGTFAANYSCPKHGHPFIDGDTCWLSRRDFSCASTAEDFPDVNDGRWTLTPAKVFVVGAGVAGLQAIATAKRLGAAVSAYDVRPAVKEQVQTE